MSLLDGVRAAVQRLGPRGWAALLARHGLELNASELSAELIRPLSGIDRTIVGFEDFSPQGRAAIEPGSPARSLLYHALASPDVHPEQAATRTDEDYPTLQELDAVENYVYGTARRKLSTFRDPVIALFAYQYRT